MNFLKRLTRLRTIGSGRISGLRWSQASLKGYLTGHLKGNIFIRNVKARSCGYVINPVYLSGPEVMKAMHGKSWWIYAREHYCARTGKDHYSKFMQDCQASSRWNVPGPISSFRCVQRRSLYLQDPKILCKSHCRRDWVFKDENRIPSQLHTI